MDISIIIPVYNVDKYLSKCLDSILSQTFTDYEVIMVDDGSTDTSGSICDEYAKKDKRIKVIHKENGGVSSARNCGLRQSRGTWICFVDADDSLLQSGLQILFSLSEANPDVDMVIAGFLKTDGIKNIMSVDVDNSIYKIPKEKALLQMFVPTHHQYIGYPWAKLYRASVIVNNQIFFDTSIAMGEDLYFNVMFICHCIHEIMFTATPVYAYNVGRMDSAMNSIYNHFDNKIFDDFKVHLYICKTIKRYMSDRDCNYYSKLSLFYSYRKMKKKLKYYHKDDILRQIGASLIKNISFISYVSFKFRHLVSLFLKKTVGKSLFDYKRQKEKGLYTKYRVA